MTDPPERPVQSSRDALAASGDEAGEALGEVKDELHASLDRIAQLAGPAASSLGMRNLTAELQDIGTTMARALDNAEEQVTQAFATETDALDSVLRGAHLPTSAELEHVLSMFVSYPWTDLEPEQTLQSNDAESSNDVRDWSDEVGNLWFDFATSVEAYPDNSIARQAPPPHKTSPSLEEPVPADDTVVEITADGANLHDGPAIDERASRSNRTAEFRRKFLVMADDVDASSEIMDAVPPPYQAPQPPPGAEVDDPASAAALATMVTWEVFNQWIKRQRE